MRGDQKFFGEEVLGGIANFRWPLKISGRLKSDRKFVRWKYQAERGFPVVTPFGDYNIKGSEEAPEIVPWRGPCNIVPGPRGRMGTEHQRSFTDLCGPDFFNPGG